MTGRGAAPVRTASPAADFDRGRAEALRSHTELRRRAARTVTAHALTSADRATLLAMLDLPTPPDADQAFDEALSAYVRAVAAAAGAATEGVTHRDADAASAVVPLGRRSAAHPDHDLALVWGERRGWVVQVQTHERTVVLGATDGDTAADPQEVARFVRATVDHHRPGRPLTTRSGRPDRIRLAARLRRSTTEENTCRMEP